MRKILSKLLFIVPFFLFFITPVSAKIEVQVNRTYTINSADEMEVTEEHTIRNNTVNKYIPAAETIEFQILDFKINDPNSEEILRYALNSSSLTVNGATANFTHSLEENQLVLTTKYNEDLNPGDLKRFVLKYKHKGLVYRNGALLDAYIHAFSPDFKFETNTASYRFFSTLVVPKSLPPINFISPNPTNTIDDGISIRYQFDQNALLNQFVWIQLGKEQIYDFEIIQTINNTEEKITGLDNRYEIILPRNIAGGEVEQTIYFSEIIPPPSHVYVDEENNLIGIFKFPSHQQQDIIIRGYAYLQQNDQIDYSTSAGTLSDFSDQMIQKYTTAADYWEVDAEEIKERAEAIAVDETNVYAITEQVYHFVVDSIDYSEVKRFGLNKRQGALKTLQGGAAVCMEYSDLFLTLMRAKGIPARAVFGYAYDSRVSETEQEAHQWVQVYMPNMEEWIDVDVTWGESGDVLIGGDLNHFYTHVAYKDPNTPAMISRYAYGTNTDLNTPKFNIKTIRSVPANDALLTSDDLISRYSNPEDSLYSSPIEQITSRYKAGFASLKDGLDIQNTSQVLALFSVLVGFVVVSFIINFIKSLVQSV